MSSLTAFEILEPVFAVSILLLPLCVLANILRVGITSRVYVYICGWFHVVGIAHMSIHRHEYAFSGWSAIKNYDFSFQATLFYYFPLALLLLSILVIMTVLFMSLELNNFSRKRSSSITRTSLFSRQISSSSRKAFASAQTLPIVLLTTFSVFFAYLQLSQGWGMVGVTNPTVPFKIVGFVVYSTKFLIPLLIFLFYFKSRLSVNLAYLILLTGLIAGCAQLSRFTYIISVLPILAIFLLLKPKQILHKCILIVLFLYGLDSVNDFRYFTYNFLDEQRYLVKDMSIDVFTFLIDNVVNFFSVETFYSSWRLIVEIIMRVSGPRDIILGGQMSSEAIGGDILLALSMLFPGSFSLDHDEYMLELIGITLPTGYSAGLLPLGKLMVFWKSSFFLLILFSVLIAFALFICELFSLFLWRKHKNNILYIFSAATFAILILLYLIGSKLIIFALFTFSITFLYDFFMSFFRIRAQDGKV